MKKCKKCNKNLAVSSYYKHRQMANGILNICKTCTKKRVSKHRRKNIERIRAYDRSRGNRQDASYRKYYYQKNKEISKMSKLKYIIENPEKRSAHNIVTKYILNGSIKKPTNCSTKGCSKKKIQAHHDDYSKPLDIMWLCTSCHGLRHRFLNEKRRMILNEQQRNNKKNYKSAR